MIGFKVMRISMLEVRIRSASKIILLWVC